MPKAQPKQRGRPPKSAKIRNHDVEFRPKRTRHTGTMRADEVLTIDAFCERFKVTRNHIVDMRRKGLIVRLESEKNLRIVGADYIQFLLTMPNAVPRPREEESPM